MWLYFITRVKGIDGSEKVTLTALKELLTRDCRKGGGVRRVSAAVQGRLP